MNTALFPFADEEDKVGYFDRDLNIVIPPMDGGIADIFLGGFSEGLALIRDEKTSLKGFI
ncbi:MAG: hypothetical protein GY795_12335, partial [Desulfobacterales bacterium]|nr:hypothetical protein [Desulfobacterales bacterium]